MTDVRPLFDPATADAEAVCDTIKTNLIGATICGTVRSSCGRFAGMRVTHPIHGQRTVWIDSDGEGNACGAISLSED